MAKTVLVVPCYNEAQRLPAAELLAFAREHPQVGFVLVNDGSADDTLTVLQRLQQAAPGSFEVLDLQPNRGKAEAVRHGMHTALTAGSGDGAGGTEAAGPQFAGYWDADLATPLDAVLDFLEVMHQRPGVQIVVGSRVRLLGRRIERRAVRHYLGRVFATAVSQVLGLPIYDTQCGAKLFRNTAVTRSLFEQPFITGWVFDVELLARYLHTADAAGLPPAEQCIVELPLMQWVDVAGSKVKPTAFLRAPWQIFRIWRHYRRGWRVARAASSAKP